MLRRPFPTLLTLGLVAILATSSLAGAEATRAAQDETAPVVRAVLAQGSGETTSRPSKRFQQALRLTDEQVAQIREVHTRHAAEFRQLGQSLRQARTDLKQAALNGGDVKGTTAAVAALLAQMTELRATTLQEIAPILSPEQRDAMAKMSPRGHWHRGPRPTQS